MLLLLLLHTFNGLFSRITWVIWHQKGKPFSFLAFTGATSKRWSGSNVISWTICKPFAPHSRQITTPVPHHSVFTGQMPFLLPNQQHQSNEGTVSCVRSTKMLITNRQHLGKGDHPSKQWGKITTLLLHGVMWWWWAVAGVWHVCSGSRSGFIHHHDVRVAQHLVGSLAAHQQEVCGLKWSPDGKYLASGGNDNLLNIWPADPGTFYTSGTPVYTFSQHQAAVKASSVALVLGVTMRIPVKHCILSVHLSLIFMFVSLWLKNGKLFIVKFHDIPCGTCKCYCK